ncbi:MAG: aldo/keto reductase [Chloroflexi bacterium]|nr:aldo/keto reductase [Chloroflexota bacterium]
MKVDRGVGHIAARHAGRNMQKRQLGSGGPEVPVICLGAWPLGGGMGRIPDDQAIATIHASIDAGANFIDTAEGYRTSESVLGEALKDQRDDVVLATKLTGNHSLKHMTSAVENSLRALGTDHIDLYQLHGHRPDTPIAETMANLETLREAGKIRYIGVSNFSGEQHREAAQYGVIHSSQPRYNMLYRKPEEAILPACLELGIGVIPHSPLAKGMLTGKYRPGHTFASDDERTDKPEFKDDVFAAAMPVVEKLLAWAADNGREGAQLAIAWTLAHPAVISCIVGAKTPEQAIYNAAAGDWRLSDGDMAEISEILGEYQLTV